jgi:hypothetical protein
MLTSQEVEYRWSECEDTEGGGQQHLVHRRWSHAQPIRDPKTFDDGTFEPIPMGTCSNSSEDADEEDSEQNEATAVEAGNDLSGGEESEGHKRHRYVDPGHVRRAMNHIGDTDDEQPSRHGEDESLCGSPCSSEVGDELGRNDQHEDEQKRPDDVHENQVRLSSRRSRRCSHGELEDHGYPYDEWAESR